MFDLTFQVFNFKDHLERKKVVFYNYPKYSFLHLQHKLV